MNNKITVTIIILISAVFFAWLVKYGWKNRFGSPETYEIQEPKSLAVSYHSDKLALEQSDLFAKVWDQLAGVDVTLSHQITEKPWSAGMTPSVTVQAFHNDEDIYFRMTWQDDQADTVVSVNSFTDGCAVAVPLDADAPVRSIMMGFSSPVNIWHWQASKDVNFWEGKTNLRQAYSDFTYPFEQEELQSVTVPKLVSAVTDLLAQRAGSLTRKDTQAVQGRGLWRDGTWTVVFKRSLVTGNAQYDCQFLSGKQVASFAVWDGDQDDRDSRKSISEWVNLQIESPKSQASREQPLEKKDNNDTRIHKTSWLEKLGSFSLVTAAYAASGENQTIQTDREPRVINLIAKRFEYSPNRISVQKGELLTIRMESLDVTHGFYLDGYGVKIKARPGLIGKVTFVADKTGRFSFRCSETCGEFHPYMIGFMDVSPNSRFNVFTSAMGISFIAILGIVFLRGKQKMGVETND